MSATSSKAALELELLDLGVKGTSRILKSMSSRSGFLSDSSHRLMVHFTLKHGSWINQIEIWLGTLMRKRLKRGNSSFVICVMTQDLKKHSKIIEDQANPWFHIVILIDNDMT